MPYRNGHSVSTRKHGARFSDFGLLSGLLLSVCCCLEASGPPGDGRTCSPCPGNCSCAAAGAHGSCLVNCSNAGLERGPAAADLPSDTSVLDLSRNRIPSIHISLFDRLTSLKELDLSSNPLECDCSLYRLVSWLQERGVHVRRPSAMLCHQPAKVSGQPLLNVSLLTCGLNYAGCLQDEHIGGRELVIFTSSTEGNFSREQCNSLCFFEAQRYGGLGEQGECLCSTNSEPNLLSESQCSAACADPQVMKKCGWTVAPDVFQVGLTALFSSSRTSVNSKAVLSVSSSVSPINLFWHFGDQSPQLNTSTPYTIAEHKYALPGHYQARVRVCAAHKEFTASGKVSVTLPPRLELQCPSMVVANQSLVTTLVNWGGVGAEVDWEVLRERDVVARATPPCPPDLVLQGDDSYCFQLVAGEFSWSEARHQCSGRGGELAVVRTEAVRNFLAPHITQERGVWLGLSDIETPGSLSWIDGSDALQGEGGGRDRAMLIPGNVCVSLDNSGLPSSHPCSAKRAYICQFSKLVRVPDAGVFMVGSTIFNTHAPLASPTVIQTSDHGIPAKSVELLLFPSMSFVQHARLASLEFVTQPLNADTQVRFQIYRPLCPSGMQRRLAGCGELCAPIAICQTPDEPFNQTAFRPPSCPPQQQWCPFQRNCLPLSQPCHSTSCFNCSQVDPLPAITVPPIYSLLSEVMFILPPGASTHQLVKEGVEDLLISPGDFIALQHDAGPGSFLHCSRDSSSPWRQSIQVLNSSCWIGNNSILGEADDKQWLHDRVCLLRVLHVGQNKTTLKGSLFSAGLPHPGDYSLEVTSNDPDFPVKASCPIHVVPPLGLSVVYPYRQNGTVFFRPNQTSLLVTVQSQHTAVVRWQGSNETFHFQSSCPLEFVSQVVECREPDHKNQTWFALVDLQLIETADQVLVELTAENEVTTDILTIPAKVELPLWGLQVHPHPNCRVLVSSLASYTVTVAGGTNPTFKWIVDDKSFYTYYNSNFNVIYKNAASYKLTVIAMNHVSNLTEDFIVSVGRMNPMSNITVSGVPSIVTQGSNLTLSVNFSMDISVNATIRWSFGDGGYKVHYIPPHDYLSHYPEFQDQVELTEKIYYVYEQPGVYTLLVSVSNCYENKTQKMDVYVFSILKWEVTINTEPSMLKAGRPAEFEADPGPSPYGIVYTWDFGDNTTKLQGRERRVSHTYINGGVYSVCVSVNNTISSTGNCTNMMVYEEINCLEVMSSAPTELNTPTVITAHLESGNNITWTFDMGDGNVLIGTEPHVRHTYMKDGNYTVNVTATNPVSSQSKFITVQIFVLHVRWLEPTGCIQEDTEVQFHAFVSGNASAYMYEWSFGDGTLNSTGSGTPGILHSYSASGEYLLSLLLSSGVNKVNFYTWICVQPAVTNVSIVPISSHIRLGDEGKFRVIALPEFNYNYIWDFGTDDSQGALHGEEEITFTYRNPGQYLVMVTVWNNISSSNDSVLIEVQKPVGPLMIQHNSSRGSNLAVHQIYMFTASLDSTDVRYFWDFGDGNVLTGRNVTHAYNSSGNFNIHLLGSNAVSNNSSNVVVSVLAPIQGLFINASQVNVPLNISVHFEALKDQGDRVRFSWILCDHCTSIPGSHTMFYTFRSVGTFNVIVTAKNEINTAQANILIFVQRELEGLQIIAEELGERCCYSTNKVLHLQASLREGTNMSFNWNVLKEHDITTVMNFSGRSTELNFSHPGLCEVILKATNLLGQLVVNKTIQFLDPIDDLSLNISPNPVAVNHNAKMTVFASIGSDLRYSWSVDGVLLSQMNNYVPHRFISPGMKHIQANVSNEISNKSISLWVSVQEPITGIRFTASNVTETNFVASGDNITFQGAIQTGTNVSWAWLLPSGTKTGQSITSYSFSNAGMFLITLNASNDVSEKTVSQNFTVQNRIQGLDLKASKSFVALGENVEFTFSIMSGTSVNFILSISGDATVELQNQTYVHQFSRVDTYIVNLTAHNQVSSERKHLQVEVMEPVSRLTIVDCCKGAIPVGVTKTFIAEIHTGNPVTFLWTFDLRHDPDKTSFFGKEVTYTPKDPGTLTIFLRAFNSLHGQNITKIIQVQNVLTSATLEAQPNDTFINKEVVFRVTLGPRYTSAAYHWDFGDGTTVTSNSPSSSFTLSHIYTQPGLYLVRVNASNLVSFILAQVEVNIRVLECEEPEVQVIQAPKLSVWRYQSVLLEANVDLKGCAHYGVQYLWDIFSTPHCHEGKQGSSSRVRLPSELDMHKIQLSVPKMSLRAGNYSIVFSLSYEGVPLRKAACLQLSVMSGRLVPIIEGGTYRVWSKTQDLQLSAEQSYDPNLNLESQSLLTYHWECENTSKGPAHCSTLNFGLGSSGPVLGISGSELEADVEYTFRLTVSKEGMPSESTVQTVLVQSGRIPIVLLECVSCKAQSIYEVSQNSKVYLAGTCSNCQSSHRGRWTAMTQQNETLVLDSTTTTTGSEGMRLVLRQGILRDFESYIFSLRVTDDTMDREGVAYIMLRPNKPPSGGSCSLWASVAGTRVRSLQDKVHFNCTGYTDLDDSPTPLLYSLLVMRCTGSFCEEFCVYKGTSPEHATYLPSGFHSALNRVVVSVTVEDHQGASIIALNKTMEVVLPEVDNNYSSLPHYLSNLTETRLQNLLKQGDSQGVRELSLALITVLNEYEQTRPSAVVTRAERQYRVSVRGNITRALTSLDLNTVNDIQQTSAALAQCTAVSREFVCEECQNSTLNKLESMLEILQTDTKQGTVTPTEIADNILNIMGDLIHQVSQAAAAGIPSDSEDRGPHASLTHPLSSEDHHPLRVAAKAYTLSSELMRILMHSRVLNEEPLILRGAEIAAAGKRADPQSLLCYDSSSSPECQRFSIPRTFNTSLSRAAAAGNTKAGGSGGTGVVQLLFQVEPNPFPFNYVANYTVSTEVASMEFRTENGTQIPISGLDENQAITVAVNNGTGAGLDGVGRPAGSVNVSRCSHVIVRVDTGNSNRQAGIYIQLNLTVVEDGSEEREPDPAIMAYLHSSDWPNEYNCSDRKHISLSMTRGKDLDHRRYTFFVSPVSHDTTLVYYINVTTGCAPNYPALIRLEAGVFSSLCQYFSESAKLWRTDGMAPLAETNASRAVCSTRHLTAFAASLFVPPDAVEFITPVPAGRSLVAVLSCLVGLICYAVAAAILNKLDRLELKRAAVVPLCGKDGLHKYEVQVKTGWSRGAGTTAHIGISLYGRESRSGHRHLDTIGAFARNNLDIFRIATDTNLGNIWKIRIWHDNKGLSPAWFLQYVLVKDLQSGNSYFFLVEEWLSVDNENTDGRVEIEVEASEEAELLDWRRLLSWELQRALCDSHIWLSLWERPRRSPFSGLQRATCCASLLSLSLLANAVWYATVTHGNSSTAVSHLVSLNSETLGVGLVSCLVVYPLYLLTFCLFRLSRSKVLVEQLPPPVDQESLEIDDFLDDSMTGSSLLVLNGIHGETYSEETNIDLPTPSTKSLQRWSVPDLDCPETVSDTSVVGMGLPPRLKRGQGSRYLGVDMAFNTEDEEGVDPHRNKYFTSSDEDLIKRILVDGQLPVSHLCDAQQLFSQPDSDVADLSSILGDKTEVILLQKLSESQPAAAVRREPPKTAFTNHTVVTDVCKPRPLPPWCGRVTLWGNWAGLLLSSSLTMWLGRSMNGGVALMWLISCMASFLSSFCLLEPLKVLCEGLYFALVVGRLRAEQQDVLVELPRVKRMLQRVPRLRPPQGFALAQAREEARKVRMLHNTLKGFLLYMFSLLVVLLLCYTDSASDTQQLQLRTQLQQRFNYSTINSRDTLWTWLSGYLLPQLLDGPTLMYQTGSLLLGTPRLRQIRAPTACPASGYFPGSSWFGCVSRNDTIAWSGQGFELASNWTASSVDNSGVWHWGQVWVYGSGGFVQELSQSLEVSRGLLQNLQKKQWLDPQTRAVFVEFSLYNTNTDLLSVLTFLLEFSGSERALSSLDLKTCRLHRLSQGLDLPLLLTVLLLAFGVVFCVWQGFTVLREGRGYFSRTWNSAGVLSLVLALLVVTLHLSTSALADRQWALLLLQRRSYTSFYGVVQQSQVLTVLMALLLFLLVLKASHQLRFLREWAVFGRALRHSAPDLLAALVAMITLLLAYSYSGHMLFHSVLEEYGSVGSACLYLLAVGGRGLPLHPAGSAPFSGPSLAFHTSFAVLRLGLLWVVTSALLRNYQRARAELYQPAVEMQDYEMVELFLRRLKMWMGLSRVKEFRHNVHFEGMELPRSRSSSTSDCKSLCLPPLDNPEPPPTPDSIDGGSESSWRLASSSPCSLVDTVGLGQAVVVGGSAWRERAETEATLRRVLPTFEALLQQLDRVTQATEELYQTECWLEQAQRRSRSRSWGHERSGGAQRKNSRGDSAGQRRQHHQFPQHKRDPQKPSGTQKCKSARKDKGTSKPDSAPLTPTPPKPCEWSPPTLDSNPPSSLFRHPAHTTTIPTRKRKHKAPPLKNKVHPNPDRPVSGHLKP
ncbi:polycystin-1 isoform X2 [Denticeps clupeoides]|uniref:polycystin-1 isoform X2 n=1 Tax=Denticeps clupeoides TaxID=299321 RepID=UPI0010A3340D|nr:polycystin-1 isoform X2 [Denticeps clupeoides]